MVKLNYKVTKVTSTKEREFNCWLLVDVIVHVFTVRPNEELQLWCTLIIHLFRTTDQSRLILTQAWKQTSGDPSGQTWNYRGITLYSFTIALLYMVSSVTMARIVARLLNIY